MKGMGGAIGIGLVCLLCGMANWAEAGSRRTDKTDARHDRGPDIQQSVLPVNEDWRNAAGVKSSRYSLGVSRFQIRDVSDTPRRRAMRSDSMILDSPVGPRRIEDSDMSDLPQASRMSVKRIHLSDDDLPRTVLQPAHKLNSVPIELKSDDALEKERKPARVTIVTKRTTTPDSIPAPKHITRVRQLLTEALKDKPTPVARKIAPEVTVEKLVEAKLPNRNSVLPHSAPRYVDPLQAYHQADRRHDQRRDHLRHDRDRDHDRWNRWHGWWPDWSRQYGCSIPYITYIYVWTPYGWSLLAIPGRPYWTSSWPYWSTFNQYDWQWGYGQPVWSW